VCNGVSENKIRHQKSVIAAMIPIKSHAFDLAFSLVVNSLARKVPRSRLNALFNDLKKPAPVRDPDETTDLIWAIWIDHRDEEASHRMAVALEAIAAGAKDLAKPILDELVESHPDWAEAWNKRATLAFIEKRDDDSIEDIAKTLALEPRHFGAILGFAQICMRHDRLDEAKAAFEIARTLNPHIEGIEAVITELAAERHPLH
jgi:predicted Zn-dependent protease